MLFNSFAFLLFFPIVCLLYFTIPPRFRNYFLLIASYYFYMNWEPVYAVLILFSTIITWCCALFIEKTEKQRNKKFILTICLLLNLSILFLFKYANFINNSVESLLELFHLKINIPEFHLLLPVGISFYTFQAIGYTIDVYRKTIKAEKNIFTYALFVSFFPQLVAGPIERAKNLLPQFYKIQKTDYVRITQGLKLMLWGYFMKVVVADRLAVYVDAVYDNPGSHSGITLIIATVFFAFQIYCDFGGYSNIAIGCAKVMGFDLMTNFKRPYLATDISDFWHRWHISLSTWFRDYLYIPLGGNRCGTSRNYFNLMCTFIISGIWHGANWTFVIWGTLNGAYQVLEKIFKSRRTKYIKIKENFRNSKIIHFSRVIFTFILICFSWIFFRANNVNEAFLIIKRIFTARGNLFIKDPENAIIPLTLGTFAIIILLLSDILQEYHTGRNTFLDHKKRAVRYASYLSIVIMILIVGVFDNSQFIYFQF